MQSTVPTRTVSNVFYVVHNKCSCGFVLVEETFCENCRVTFLLRHESSFDDVDRKFICHLIDNVQQKNRFTWCSLFARQFHRFLFGMICENLAKYKTNFSIYLSQNESVYLNNSFNTFKMDYGIVCFVLQIYKH